MKLRLIPLLAAALLLSACGDAYDGLPEGYVEPTFYNTFQKHFFRAPDGAEMPVFNGLLPSGDEEVLLHFTWSYPAPTPDRAKQTDETVAVCQWFWYRGLLFDLDELVETAKSDWAEAQESCRKFQSYVVSQDTTLVCETERYWSFRTTVGLPKDYPYAQICVKTVYADLFDRSTGEPMDVWELFSVPEDEARAGLIRACLLPKGQIETEGRAPITQADLERFFDSAAVIFGQEALEVAFPAGTLAENLWFFHLEYPDLADILQPWAVPDPPENPLA